MTTTTTTTTRRYYALHWFAGRGTCYADDGSDCVDVYGFDSAAERDAACGEYLAPNHRPTACLEPAPASDANVALAIQGTAKPPYCCPVSYVRKWSDV